MEGDFLGNFIQETNNDLKEEYFISFVANQPL